MERNEVLDNLDFQQEKKDEIDKLMISIVKCPKCGRYEYYGMIYMRDGELMCRECIYDLWESESLWRRTPSDMAFPIYETGIDYTNLTAEEREAKSTEELF